MRVLVVGGSGFIGTRLIGTLLMRGHTVENFDRTISKNYPELTTSGDVCNTVSLASAAKDKDAVVHLAAEHRDDVTPISLYSEVNVGGANALIDAVTKTGVNRIVFTSTVAIYGLDKNNAAESSDPDPFNEYGRTKLEAEQLFTEWALADTMRTLTIVRPSVVFGEGNRGNVYNLARQIYSRRFLMVGDGSNRKSMSYVGNIVEFLADSLDTNTGVTTVNYADKPDLTTRELVTVLRTSMDIRHSGGMRLPLWLGLSAGHTLDLVAKVTRRTFSVSAIRIHKFVADTTVNTDRLAATGFRPPYSLEEAIYRTIEAEFPSSERKRR